MEPILLTFPRCGSHYLGSLIRQNAKIQIPQTHIIGDALLKFPISIIRNPKDSFISQIAMDKHYGLNRLYNNLADGYIKMYKYLIENESLLIKYEDLIDSPELVTINVCNYLGHPIKEVVYKDYLFDQIQNNHLVSSKKSEYYSTASVPEEYLIEANNYYLKALSYCITIL